MKSIPLPVAALAAIALAGCSGGDARNEVAANVAGDAVSPPAMIDEPALPANQAETRMDERTSAPGAIRERAPPASATETTAATVPKPARREPQPARMPSPAPKEEPADPHAGHDMANMSH